jgi:hypothetical protein
MFEQWNLEEAMHLAGLGLDMIRESKSSARCSLRSQLRINMLEARLGSNDKDDWRIAYDLVSNVLCNNANNLSIRIIKLRIMSKFEEWEEMRSEVAEAIDIYDNIVMHYEDETRRLKMAAEINERAQMCGAPEILFDNPPNSIHFQDKVIISKIQEETAPFTRENFLNGLNEDSMLEEGLVSVRKKKRAEKTQWNVIPSCERSMRVEQTAELEEDEPENKTEETPVVKERK